jgi:prepilin-type N-terminal cleavage/methylation domain-containing protein
LVRVLEDARATVDDGFTLVEVIVAALLLAVGIAALAGVMNSSFNLASRTTSRARATAIATETLEAARAVRYADLPAAPGTTTSQRTVGGSTYAVERGVTWTADASNSQAYKTVTVSVAWADTAGAHEVHQSSYVYPAGSSQTTTTLAGTGTPLAPLSLLASLPLNVSGAVDLTWTPPSSGPRVARWIVEKSTDAFISRIWRITDREPPESRTLRVAGLAAGTAYQFRVAAVGADGTLSAWSPVATAATAASLIADPCRTQSLVVSPAAVTRLVRGVPSRLVSTPKVSVETSGACTSFSVRYTSGIGTAVVLPLVRSGNLWTADVDNSVTAQWQVGPTTIELRDSTNATQGTLTLVVCEQGSTCS